MYSIVKRVTFVTAFWVSVHFISKESLQVGASYVEKNPRRPLNPRHNSLLSTKLFTDRSEYFGLGDHVGSVIALGDFTGDRYIDLLVAQDARHMRAVHVLRWNHHDFVFQKASPSRKSLYKPHFSLDSINGLTSESAIASAAVFDANADGLVDVVLSIRIYGKRYVGILLLGDGRGCLRVSKFLPGLTPGLLIMDANEDMVMDIFHVSSSGQREFYINKPPGNFTRKVWTLEPPLSHCKASTPFNSNAFVDIDGDCEPDLVISSTCGLEVWFNTGIHQKGSWLWGNGRHFGKDGHDFTNASSSNGVGRMTILSSPVWSSSNGDGHATFADFNGDGSTDIGVTNEETGQLRISYNIRRSRYERKLCAVDPNWHFRTEVALENVRLSDTVLGSTRVQGKMRVGDFNFDSKLDILLVDAESGTLSLYMGKPVSTSHAWLSPSGMFSLVDRLLFPITGGSHHKGRLSRESLRFQRYHESPILYNLEDPLAATFVDLDEDGRQDILVSQLHGTRLIWNSYRNIEDAVYFKATGVNSPHSAWRSPGEEAQAFSPLPGNTFKVTYGGRLGRETHVCTQCPQTGVMSLDTCTCLFGITRIANYIEEMAMGGAGGVRTWNGLMPNALAVVWPQGHSSQGSVKWKVSYLSKGRDGQMRRIVLVLCTTLVILFCAIVYIHSLEKSEVNSNKLDVGYMYS